MKKELYGITPELYKNRIHVKTNSYVDMYFTWGSKQTELIKQVNNSIKYCRNRKSES